MSRGTLTSSQLKNILCRKQRGYAIILVCKCSLRCHSTVFQIRLPTKQTLLKCCRTPTSKLPILLDHASGGYPREDSTCVLCVLEEVVGTPPADPVAVTPAGGGGWPADPSRGRCCPWWWCLSLIQLHTELSL